MAASDLFSLFVVLWSEKQQAFHTQTVDEMLKANWDSFYHRRRSAPDSDWIVVGFADSREDASDIVRRLRAGMDLPVPD